MADLAQRFEQAQKDAMNLRKDPGNEAKLALYALYKQATAGDANGKRPGMLDVVGRYKYDAWAKLQGTDHEAAMERYIAAVKQLQASQP
jgi:acyl-CoA-binding protein